MDYQIPKRPLLAKPGDAWIIVGLCIALACALAAFALLWKYKTSPGTAARAPMLWPVASNIPRDARKDTLILFAHPRCACTRASLVELRNLMSEASKTVEAYVVFVPDPLPSNASQFSNIEASARDIPRVHVLSDKDGRERTAFGAATSGQTLLYDAHGRLLFSGGVTGARGHEGSNGGLQALRQQIDLRSGEATGSHVFGCALDSPNALQNL